MILDISNKVIGITGAAQGIGKEIAIDLANEGCKLAICDVDREKLAETEKEFTAQGFSVFADYCDISDSDSVRTFVEKAAAFFGRIDGWINNAGVGFPKYLLEVEPKSFDKLFAINTKSVLLTAQALFPYLKETGGTIVNAASWGGIMPRAGLGAYGASKAAVMSLTRTLAAEMAPYGIRVVAYAPGIVVTPLTKQDVMANPKSFLSSISLNRPGTPTDIAKLVIFLLSDAAAYITGTTVDISGGKFVVQNAPEPWERAGASAE